MSHETVFTLTAGSFCAVQSESAPSDGFINEEPDFLTDRHEAAGTVDLVAAEAPLAANSHLLERVLQLRPVHLLPGTHNPGPEVSDPVHVGADHLGLLLPAVFLVGGQLPGRTLQENVSVGLSMICCIYFF